MSKIRLSFGNISLVLALGALVVSSGDVRAQKSFRGGLAWKIVAVGRFSISMGVSRALSRSSAEGLAR